MYIEHPLIKKDTIESREYQENLAGVAGKSNTLIVVPTALGKTIIAALVSVEALEKTGRKILFLAPTKPLANQHLKSFRDLVDVEEMVLLTGETKVKDRKQKWIDSKIIFATPQTIKNSIEKRHINMKDVGLLIVDEAHRAVGDYAYVKIAKNYASKENAHILALTASPGSTKEKIKEVCDNLFIEHVEMRTEEDSDVKPYVHKKEMEWVRLDLPPEFKDCQSHVKNAMSDILKRLKSKNLIQSASLSACTRTKLLKLQKKFIKMKEHTPLAFSALSDVAELMKLQHARLLVETQGMGQFRSYLRSLEEEQTRAARRITSNRDMIRAREIAEAALEKNLDHPKMNALVDLIEETGKKGIVFTHYRSSAEKVEDLLNEKGIPAKRFIGQSSRKGRKGLKQKEQIELIKQFREGKYQILVATAIGEEGLDIPSVDLVVFYEPVASAIRKIQRAGRTGRKAPGKVVVLITRGTADEAYYWSSRKKEREMKRVITDLSADEGLLKEKQKTLADYANKVVGEPIVYVDHRERACGVIGELDELGMRTKTMQLPVGDFLVSDRTVIERKSTSDFVKSILDGRLFKQAKRLAENFEKPVIIMEGENVFSVSNVHPNAIRGAMASVIINSGVPIIPTKDTKDTAALISVMAKREQKDAGRVARLRGERSALTDRQQQIFIIESLPGVGAVLARELLARFGSVEGVLNASERELKQVDKIGEKKAKEIKRILSKGFDK